MFFSWVRVSQKAPVEFYLNPQAQKRPSKRSGRKVEAFLYIFYLYVYIYFKEVVNCLRFFFLIFLFLIFYGARFLLLLKASSSPFSLFPALFFPFQNWNGNFHLFLFDFGAFFFRSLVQLTFSVCVNLPHFSFIATGNSDF